MRVRIRKLPSSIEKLVSETEEYYYTHQRNWISRNGPITYPEVLAYVRHHYTNYHTVIEHLKIERRGKPHWDRADVQKLKCSVNKKISERRGLKKKWLAYEAENRT